MKVSTVFVLLITALLFNPDKTIAQDVVPEAPEGSQGKYLMMRTFEIFALRKSKMYIVDENGQVEETEMANLKQSIDKSEENLIIINNKLNELVTKGYQLESVTSAGYPGVLATTYLFRTP